jgi:(p)ppGpp synthase/HD superfamily hydrolase
MRFPVSRLRPTRMHTTTSTIHGLSRALAQALEAYANRLDVDKIRDAYDVALEAHGGQTRASGDSARSWR